MTSPRARGAAAVRGLPRDLLHIAVLSSLAIAQPLFDLLGKNPAFFAAHDIGPLGVVVFGLVLVLGPPLIAAVIEILAGFIGPRARRATALVLIGLLMAIVALQIVRRIDALGAAAIFALCGLVAVVATAAYARVEGVRSFLSVLAPAPLIFLLLFLLVSPASKITLGGSAKAFSLEGSRRPPIVFVVFDAFPGLNLQKADGTIDAERYPNLAELSRDGRWYRNASNVHENTVFSVPSILDAKLPRKGQLPVVQDHRNNLFTLLGNTYTMNVAEEATNLCPPGLCSKTNSTTLSGRISQLASDVSVVYEYLTLPKSYRDDLPEINDTWAGFRGRGVKATRTERRGAAYVIQHLREGRAERFRRAVSRISATGGRPQLNFVHAFFPHEPRQYLPDGKQYQAGPAPDSSLEGPPSYDNQFLSQQGWQRELLQLGFTDRLVGELIARLKRLGIYDEALIVITADHGESFQVDPKPAPPFVPGRLGYRRAARPGNLADIASIPLFIKYPKGLGPTGIDDRYVRTIDILPTIAATLGIKLPFRVDGRSLLDPSYAGVRQIREELTFGSPLTMSASDWQAQRRASRARRLALFGSGDREPGLYRLGPRPDLVGKRVADLTVSADGSARATILEADRFRRIDTSSGFSPSFIAGRISGEPGAGHDLAFALNGEIVATSSSYESLGPNHLNWSVMLPEDTLRDGPNSLEVFQVSGSVIQRIAQAP